MATLTKAEWKAVFDEVSMHIVDKATIVNEGTVELLKGWLKLAEEGKLQDVLISGKVNGDVVANASGTMSVGEQLGATVLLQRLIMDRAQIFVKAE